jgi:Peptide N-acetyl-beta-D-glucosaminyl asparaginase amidase A
VRHVRWWLVVFVTALVLVGGGITALAASGGSVHPRLVAPPGAAAAPAGAAAKTRITSGTKAAGEFSTVANPVTLDPPVKVPDVKPTVVTIANDAAFGNAPPAATSTVALPPGRWAEVVLDVTGTETGRQYDRLLNIDDGPVQIFLGVTPEPTPAGITWHLQKDITAYLPILRATRTFSTYVDNYLSSVDTGIPVITAKLLFYPAGDGFAPARTASLASPALAGDAFNLSGPVSPAEQAGVPTQVVPILPTGDSTDFNTVNAGQVLSSTVTLPDNITTAALDLYAVGQSNDEFWWGLSPSFREIEVSVDGKPAGAVWPFPYVYTGGVNPLIWRPLTGIHTMDIPSYRLDLTPFAGLLSGGGTHTITLTVAGNDGYWLAGGSLLLTAGGAPVTGTVTAHTLSFPTASQVTTSDALGSSSQPVSTEAASTAYTISGTVVQGGRTWTDTLSQSLQFGDDQTDIDPSCTTACYQWVHQETTSSGTEVIHGPGVAVSRADNASWTTDAPNGYQQNASGTDFFLPASVSQQLTDVATEGAHRTSLSESIMGYGALEEDNSVSTINDGDTTGTITAQDDGPVPEVYQRTIVTRGGVILQDLSG